MGSPDSLGTDPDTFAGRLNKLWAASTPEGQAPYTNRQVAEKINGQAGKQAITAEYIRKLRMPGGSTPSVDKADLFAKFFHVPLDYFSLTDPRTYLAVEAELDRLREQRQSSSELPPPDVMAFARTLQSIPPAKRSRMLTVFKGILGLEDE